MVKDNILAQYEASKVNGRSQFCPRKGVYKINSTYQDQCLGKSALMANVYWKSSAQENYSQQVFVIQLESFKRSAIANSSTFDLEKLVGSEIQVTEASYDVDSKDFQMTWEIKSIQSLIDSINAGLMSGSFDVNLEDHCDSEELIANDEY